MGIFTHVKILHFVQLSEKLLLTFAQGFNYFKLLLKLNNISKGLICKI